MRDDQLYEQLRKKMLDISAVPPQGVGPLTTPWKKMVPYVKTTPVKTLVLGGILSSIIIWLILGSALVKVVTFLQYGF